MCVVQGSDKGSDRIVFGRWKEVHRRESRDGEELELLMTHRGRVMYWGF
jgi:hypothetical protein